MSIRFVIPILLGALSAQTYAAIHVYPDDGDIDSILASAGDGDTIQLREGFADRSIPLDRSLTFLGVAPDVTLVNVAFESAGDGITMQFENLAFTGESSIFVGFVADPVLRIKDCLFHDIASTPAFATIYFNGDLPEHAVDALIERTSFIDVTANSIMMTDDLLWAGTVFHDLILRDCDFEGTKGCVLKSATVEGCRFFRTYTTPGLPAALNLESYWYEFPEQSMVSGCTFIGGELGIETDTSLDIIHGCRFEQMDRGVRVGWVPPGGSFVTIFDLSFCRVDEPWSVSGVGAIFDGGGHVEDEDCEPCHDLDGDWSVGFNDLATLLGTWGTSGDADLDGDGTVGFNDLATLLGVWGPCPRPF